ncbi:MAG: PDZ domain-containing protein, partial [Duncaniella sp.]|nr:PDZ domain-containing protein [Duncaniella sp.]
SGIGISFNLMGDTINVLEVISGGPSEKVGLLPGDRIVTVDDSIVAGKGFSDVKVKSMLRGPEGTTVSLGIKRATSAELLKYDVVRGAIPVTSIDAAYIIEPGIGYIRVNKFGANTFTEFIEALAQVMMGGAEKYIIDLRGNGGGYMEMAVLMANEFLEANLPIVSMKGAHQPETPASGSDGSGALKDKEIVVLIDEISASASEIFAGAMQDNDRGLIVGRRSFGKGLVQNQFELPDKSALRLTIARYYTPSGRCIQKRYAPGTDYERDLLDRYEHGEMYSADSIRQNKEQEFHTLHGRTVYGGGGIMPDIFVPNDTLGVTTYYLNVLNKGLINKFTFEYADRHRETLSKSFAGWEVVEMLPDDDTLLQEFVEYAKQNGVAPRWYYINISRTLLLNTLKAMIARNIHGVQGYFEVNNLTDPTVRTAIKALNTGKSAIPIRIDGQKRNSQPD